MSEELTDEAVSLCIRVGAPANLCQELIELLGSVGTAEAFIKACAAQGDVGLPTPKERQLLMVGDPDRGERIRKSLLSMAMISGAMPIGFGVPREGFKAFDDAMERANLEISKSIRGQGLETLSIFGIQSPGVVTLKRGDLVPNVVTRRTRSLTEKKTRRAKRKQRRNR